jgi:flagellar biosynthetic protein FlhB
MAALSPLLIVVACVAMLAPMALSGWSFSTKALAPKWSRIDPVSGMKRVFSLRGLMEVGKALLKFFLVIMAAILLMRWLSQSIVFIGFEPTPRSLMRAGGLLALACVVLVSPLLLVAAVDVPFQLWDHRRKLKMSKQEVKDEQKETEGNPQVKSRVRELQRKIAYSRMMSQVPEADVVIVNPIHFAVALKYNQDTMSAPIVLAKGADLIALQIIRTGKANHVPIASSPLLARALFYTTELNGEIPVGLYQAVAQVLAHIFQLRRTHGYRPRRAVDMTKVDVPEEYQHY